MKKMQLIMKEIPKEEAICFIRQYITLKLSLSCVNTSWGFFQKRSC